MGTAVISPERRKQLEEQAAAAMARANAPKLGTVLHTPPTGGPMMMAPPNGQPTRGQTQTFGNVNPQRQYTPNPFAMGPAQPPPPAPGPGFTNPGYQPGGPMKDFGPPPQQPKMGMQPQPQMAPPQQAPMAPPPSGGMRPMKTGGVIGQAAQGYMAANPQPQGAVNQQQMIRAIRGDGTK